MRWGVREVMEALEGLGVGVLLVECMFGESNRFFVWGYLGELNLI